VQWNLADDLHPLNPGRLCRVEAALPIEGERPHPPIHSVDQVLNRCTLPLAHRLVLRDSSPHRQAILRERVLRLNFGGRLLDHSRWQVRLADGGRDQGVLDPLHLPLQFRDVSSGVFLGPGDVDRIERLASSLRAGVPV
jgi:hypothetical protein